MIVFNGGNEKDFTSYFTIYHFLAGVIVGYLKLPEGIEEEWEEDYKDHHPANGHIQFAHGTSAGYTSSNFVIKPKVGDFYVFPSQLFHCVYPFYTKGERRSFSMNMNFIEMPKKKSVDK